MSSEYGSVQMSSEYGSVFHLSVGEVCLEKLCAYYFVSFPWSPKNIACKIMVCYLQFLVDRM